jgi:hypothetical protein
MSTYPITGDMAHTRTGVVAMAMAMGTTGIMVTTTASARVMGEIRVSQIVAVNSAR